MLVAVCLATLSALALAFYAKFLFALCKEHRIQPVCYLVRLRIHSPGQALADDDLRSAGRLTYSRPLFDPQKRQQFK
jgi:hypothetical protein